VRTSSIRKTGAELGYFEDVIKLSPTVTREYRVGPGDMLSLLVRQFYGVSFPTLWPLIRIVNPDISDPNRIRVGQTIAFPVIGEKPNFF
jgi:nucleoid-associated protein YgaU